ncbi:MAG: hypothetical protein NTY02_01770 [Acidobacteria bacterium]|nr:hypothetical protein [Acidobacteriota bacterium]
MKRLRILLLLCVTVAGFAEPGCGKKGPPLAPFVRMPSEATLVTARRQGDTVHVSFTVPRTDADATTPASIQRIEVRAYTAMHKGDVRDPREMTLAGEVPVRKPPNPDAPPPKPGEPVPPPEPGVDQGAIAVVSETLTAEMRTPVAVKAPRKTLPPPPEPQIWFDSPLTPPLTGIVMEPEPTRYYVVYGINRHGKRSGGAVAVEVPLSALPSPPTLPVIKATEKAIVLTWSPPDGIAPPAVQAVAAAPAAAAPVAALTTTTRFITWAPPLAYNVYPVDTPAAGPADAGTAGPPAAVPTPVTAAPIAALTWSNEKFEFGTERCYAVRRVVAQGPVSIESAPTPRVCVTPVDTFAPAAPVALSAVAGEGAVSLIWEGVSATDLAGYVVLRGQAPTETLTPLFDAPIRETTYRDATAKSGVRYIYAVVAIDRASPPNRSELSNKVEERAR